MRIDDEIYVHGFLDEIRQDKVIIRNEGGYFGTVIDELVEAIPKADIQKALKEGSKDISENVLAIVREEYISKADYKTRLKDDLEAILTELQLEIEELDTYDIERTHGLIEDSYAVEDVNKVIQQKINELKGEKDDKDN